MFKEEAVERAIDDCIREDVLADILEKHRSEATTMILEEYDEELHIKNEKEISYDEGKNDGIKEGREDGRKEGRIELADAIVRLRAGESAEDLLRCGLDKETIEIARKALGYTDH